MGRVYDIIESKLSEIIEKPSLFLSHTFMMNIFKDLENELPPFKQYIIDIYENKLNPTMSKQGSKKANYNASKVVGLDKLRSQLFDPYKEENIDTKEIVLEMAKVASQVWLDEMRNTSKTIHHYLSSIEGEKAWKNTTPEEHLKLLGTFATNDIAEQAFGKMTHSYRTFSMILGGNAAAIAQARTNGDWDRKLCGGKLDGTFHQLDLKMQESLILACIKHAPEARKEEHQALTKQREFK